MCGCNSSCDVIRCRGCPGSDWSAYTWRWVAPGSDTVQSVGETLERQFQAVDRSMFYPGVCGCLWLVGSNDQGRAVAAGTENPIGEWFPIASIGALQYGRGEFSAAWTLSIVRWGTILGWNDSDERYGTGWGWDEDNFGSDCVGGAYGYGGWGGYGGFGWNGLGWGYGLNWNYGLYGSAESASYELSGTFDCIGGANRFNLVTEESETFDPDNWPAYVDVSRVSR